LTSWNRVVVVSGDNFPDALAAASLAGSYTAPIILMPSDGSLPTVVKEWGLTKRDQIQANSTSAATFKLVVVGGTSAVPDAGVQALLDVLNAGDLTPATMTRISGANRAATAKAVATQTNAAGSYTILAAAKEIFVANEASFADAMAIAPYAFNASAPVLLTGKDSLGADALAVLKTYKTLTGTKVKILGGTAAVSDQVVQDIVNNAGIPLSSIQRISGADRYATSVAIQNYVDASSVNAANFDASHVVMVNGQNFADGLAAAPYAGHGTGGAARLMYLTEANAISSTVSAKMTTHAKSDYPTNVYAVGGINAVSADVISGVTTAAQALNTTSTMTCVENSLGTTVSITVPGNASDTDSAGSGWLGDETAHIKNGALTINGTSNNKSKYLKAGFP
jgi:putative cell wall-binding protein